ncbi:nitroreductase family protein [Halothiobacillus sp. DCM-1]|uniref:nitroreductase family protein n=1 Tax=Halothiobacillus sp. DCM-1 TaxID=3112558 RepID=UPI00324DCBB0
MDTLTAIKQRFSANHFSSRPVSDEMLVTLIDAARQAPSSFNQQHTRFLAVQDLAARQTLRAIAYNQAKVEEAPLVLVVLGDLRAHEHFAEVAQADVQAGIYNQSLADYFVDTVKNGYADPARAHDEAIRSGALAAMNLMTAATALGLVTGPMIGFDAAKLKKTFAIAERYLPVLMITVGYNGEGNWPKKTRRPVEELLVRDARPGQRHLLS